MNNFSSDGSRAVPYSDWGPKTDVAAPGKDLHSLSARTATTPGSTRSFGGTSAAAPVASGVAALIASQDDTLTPEQIRQILRMTASDPAAVPSDQGENTPGWDLYSGWGMVNAEAAVAAVGNGDVFPEANILSLPVNYRNIHRGEEFSIQNGTVEIKAYLGLPAGGTVDWSLQRSSNWDLSGAVQEASRALDPAEASAARALARLRGQLERGELTAAQQSLADARGSALLSDYDLKGKVEE